MQWHIAIKMAICDTGKEKEAVMAESDIEDDLIMGNAPISRCLFGTPAKRRMVPKLKADGWPIFDVAGKNAARRSGLWAEVAKRERAAAAKVNRGS